MEALTGNWIGALSILTIAAFSIKTYIDVNGKVDRNYERIDEVKDDFELKHVRKDICSILHEQLGKDILEIKTDVKKLLTKNGVK